MATSKRKVVYPLSSGELSGYSKFTERFNQIEKDAIESDNTKVLNVYDEPFKVLVPEDEEEHELLKDEDELKILTSNGEVVPLHRKDLVYLLENDRHLLKDGIIFNKLLNTKSVFNEEGLAINDWQQMDDDEFNDYQYTDYTTMYGNYTVDEEKQNKKEKKKEIKNKIPLSFKDIISIYDTPILYHNNIKEEENNINSLIVCLTQQEGQFDEKFIIKPKSPDSPLLDKYLVNLSKLVDSEINESDEIEDMEKLEKMAYESVGYIGKSFETVINESKDFQEYFRYLLIKKDKKVISQQDYDYGKKLKEIVKSKLSADSKKSINKTLSAEIINYSNKFYISEVIDEIIETRDTVCIRLFIHLPNIKKIIEYLEESKLDIKLGMLSEILNENYKKTKLMGFQIFFYDLNFNNKWIEVKANTLEKYKKKFINIITNFDKTFEESKISSAPKELRNINSI